MLYLTYVFQEKIYFCKFSRPREGKLYYQRLPTKPFHNFRNLKTFKSMITKNLEAITRFYQ